MFDIRIGDIGYREWKKRRDFKIFRQENRKKELKLEKRRNDEKKIDRSVRYLNRNNLEDKLVIAPKQFSIINNYKEVIDFFDDLIEHIYSNKKQMIFLNLSEVEEITVDALIYLLAVIKNMKNKKMMYKNPIRGNYPKHSTALEVFTKSGFLDFMNEGMPTQYSKDVSKIFYGDTHNQQIAKKMCQFVHEHSNLQIDDTHYLYNSICEMMLNTYQHAYENDNKLINNWYTYVECHEEEIRFIFFDTGDGIPSTISRRNFLGISTENDSKLLNSALNGENRSSTTLRNRGTGLESIKNAVLERQMTYLSVISNKASNVYYIENNIKKEELNQMTKSLTGTLYYWKIRRA